MQQAVEIRAERDGVLVNGQPGRRGELLDQVRDAPSRDPSERRASGGPSASPPVDLDVDPLVAHREPSEQKARICWAFSGP
jgi:hypothetical protein